MDFTQFKVNYRVIDDIILPHYNGAIIRCAFGNAFRKVVCTFRSKECKDCLLHSRCIYAYVFETPITEDTKIMRKYEYVPHPFIIEPCGEEIGEYKKDGKFSFGLTLIGKAIDYLPYFIYAFELLGQQGLGKKRAKLELESIKQNRVIIYEGSTKRLKDKVVVSQFPFTVPRRKIRSIKIIFQTPTKIVYQGKIIQEPDFKKIIPGLLRRIFLLTYFHSNLKLSIDFKGLIKLAQKVNTKINNFIFHRWVRYSSRQKKEIPMEGFTGEVVYEGELNQFYPYLKAGEVIHIGKNTAFGLGKYKVEVIK